MSVTADTVLKFKKPTEGYLCSLDANTYGVEFLSFKIRDVKTKETIFEIDRDTMEAEMAEKLRNQEIIDEDSLRCIKYNFSPKILTAKTIGTKLVFSVGGKAINELRMIERHYYGDKLLKSFDFKFGFGIPNSTNSWEAVYDVPKLKKKLIKEMIANPYATKSDSFYFANDKLIMHNKAEYAYTSK